MHREVRSRLTCTIGLKEARELTGTRPGEYVQMDATGTQSLRA